MSDTAVQEHSPRQAIDLHESAEGVIGGVETHGAAEIFEAELVGVPSVSPVGIPSIRSRLIRTLSRLGRLRIRRIGAHPHHHCGPRSQEPVRYRHHVPTLRFP